MRKLSSDASGRGPIATQIPREDESEQIKEPRLKGYLLKIPLRLTVMNTIRPILSSSFV